MHVYSLTASEIVLGCMRISEMSVSELSRYIDEAIEGVFIDNEKFLEVDEVLGRLAEEKGVSKSAIAVAWILRHPANMQVIVLA